MRSSLFLAAALAGTGALATPSSTTVSSSASGSTPRTSKAASSTVSVSSASSVASSSATSSATSSPASSSADPSTAPSTSTSSATTPTLLTSAIMTSSVGTFVPFPSPSSAAPIPGVYPATSPKNPPPVESPGIVPDFASAWTAAYEKAKAKVATFSLEERANISTGSGWMTGRCVGNTPSVRDYPGLCLEDAPLGVRLVDFVTAFPPGVNTAATWKRSLFRSRGLAMGEEHRGKGVNVALGPMMNLGRVAQGGRNWEGFGADPYLSGEAAFETILGLQEAGVQACAKHYIDNEQETFRTMETSEVDDRTQHELYTLPFIRSVMAGVASVMCSYNQINGTYACENDRMLNQILKSEIGFQGYVMSDWQATHSTSPAVNGGLDMTMPGDLELGSGTTWFGANLTAAVHSGIIPEARVTDMAERILAAWYLLEQDSDYPTVNFNAFYPDDEETNEHVDVQGDRYKIVREIGAASAVLLKNKGALPLKKPRTLALIGSGAGPARRLGPNGFSDQSGVDGILGMGWGSGSVNYTYLISPYEALQARARKDHTSFSWFFDDWDVTGAQILANKKEAAIVFVQSDSGEGYVTVDGNYGDRNNLTAWNNGDALVNAVAAKNKNTIVVVNSVGPLIIESWIENPNVTAVVWAGVSGSEAGNAIADVLYGDYNPSGRLPYTIAKDASDYVQVVNGTNFVEIPYTEGLNIDYRHFDAAGIKPRFEFGFGLSYTNFTYSGLKISAVHGQDNDSKEEANWAAGKPTPHAVGTSTALWLHRPAWKISFTVKNTGAVAGTEIPQLYLHHPSSAGEPPSLLKGFTDVDLNAGQSKTVSLTLSRFDLSIWDVVSQSWVKPDGKFGITIGASSRDARLNGTITA